MSDIFSEFQWRVQELYCNRIQVYKSDTDKDFEKQCKWIKSVQKNIRSVPQPQNANIKMIARCVQIERIFSSTMEGRKLFS